MKPYYADDQVTLWHGDALEVARTLPEGAADCIVTSPPYYGLRNYGTEGQYGLEASPEDYVGRMQALFLQLGRVLAEDGTLWLNIGDSYATASTTGPQGGTGQRAGRAFTADSMPIRGDRRPKNLLGIPWRLAFALQDLGWILRNAIVWNKPNAMPESVTDRLSGRYEHVFMFSKSRKYWFDLDPIREPHVRIAKGPKDDEWVKSTAWNHNRLGEVGSHEAGRNPGDVWELPTQPFAAAHFAVFPIQLPQRCIAAGCKPGGTVLDPFSGSGTTGLAAQRLGRKYIGIDLNAEYLDLSLNTRLKNQTLDFGEAS